MKTVTYTPSATRDLKRHGNMAARIRTAIREYATDPAAHANNVTQLVGGPSMRMRVGDFRVIFTSDATTLTVLKIAARGNAYD